MDLRGAVESGASRLADKLSRQYQKALLEKEDNAGRSKLAAAVADGAPLSEVERLLRAGAEPNHSDSSGATPLHLAVRNSDPAVVALLVRAGGWLEAKDNDKSSYRSSGQWVVNQSGRPTLKLDAQNATPILAAFAVLAELAEDADGSDTEKEKNEAVPSIANAVSVIEILIAAGASVNATDAEGKTALQYAMQLKLPTLRAKLLRLALERGADTVMGSSEIGGADQTPIAWAASRGALDVVAALLQHGTDPNLPGRDGMTPLHFAARSGRLEVVQLLLAHGAEPTALDSAGRCASVLAAANRKSACVVALREACGVAADGGGGATILTIPEADGDGAADARRTLALKHKARGNELIKQKHFREARNAYSDAIAVLRDRRRRWDDRDALKVLYANRSQSVILASSSEKTGEQMVSREELEQSLEDARLAIKLDPCWLKGWVRLLAAQKLLGRMADTIHWRLACERSVGCDNGAEKKISQLMGKYFKEWEEIRDAEITRCVQMNVAFLRRHT